MTTTTIIDQCSNLKFIYFLFRFKNYLINETKYIYATISAIYNKIDQMMKLYFSIIIIIILINQILTQQIDKICQTGLREDNTNYIYCARQNLNRIPNTIGITNIVYDELVLSDNLIEKIENTSFSLNFKVKKLYLDHNPLRHIDQASFEHIRNYLEELYFDQKQIKLSVDDDYEDINNNNNNNTNNQDKYDLDLFDKAIFQKCFNLLS